MHAGLSKVRSLRGNGLDGCLCGGERTNGVVMAFLRESLRSNSVQLIANAFS